MEVLPSAVLFCCTMNAVRSPMAEAIMKRYHGDRVFINSVGVTAGALDPLAVAVLAEFGVDLSRHQPKTFEGLADNSFDLVIALSADAFARAGRFARYSHCDLRLWTMPDPTLVEGARETRLLAYRHLRDDLREKILDLFPLPADDDF